MLILATYETGPVFTGRAPELAPSVGGGKAFPIAPPADDEGAPLDEGTATAEPE